MTTMQSRILAVIRRIPRGKVSTYGAVARAAGYPRGGEIKLRGDSAFEQRFRLQSEGVTFRGKRVNMLLHEFKFSKAKRKPAR